MTETFVRFRGMKSTGEDVPAMALGDHMRFSGVAECVQIAQEKRADGEERPVIGMRVLEVDLGEVTEAPKDEQLPFDEGDDQ